MVSALSDTAVAKLIFPTRALLLTYLNSSQNLFNPFSSIRGHLHLTPEAKLRNLYVDFPFPLIWANGGPS